MIFRHTEYEHVMSNDKNVTLLIFRSFVFFQTETGSVSNAALRIGTDPSNKPRALKKENQLVKLFDENKYFMLFSFSRALSGRVIAHCSISRFDSGFLRIYKILFMVL